MSGGVDSSVAAALLARDGHDVVGLSMQLYDQSDRDVHQLIRVVGSESPLLYERGWKWAVTPVGREACARSTGP